MPHEFVIKRHGRLETYTNYNEIPDSFDHVIKFLPEIPPEPHTPAQHDEVSQWNDKLQQLMEIERASSV